MAREIKSIYIGLPEHLKKIVTKVRDEYRTNELSLLPGGYNVVIEYQSSEAFSYDKIKQPAHYIEAIFNKRYIEKNGEDFSSFSRKKKLTVLTSMVSKIFIGKLIPNKQDTNANDLETFDFKEVWNSSNTSKLPWESIKENYTEPTQLSLVLTFYKYLDYIHRPKNIFFVPVRVIVTITMDDYKIETKEYVISKYEKIKISEAIFEIDNKEFRVPYRLGINPDPDMDLQICSYVNERAFTNNTGKFIPEKSKEIFLASNI